MFSPEMADYAEQYIRQLKHTKGKWHGVNFDLLPWQREPIRDIFGTLKADGHRQYNTAYMEIPTTSSKD